MSKALVQSYLCRPFCSFFRAGVKEEMACQGALVLAELVQRQRLDPKELPGREGKECHLWQEEDPALARALCLPCPFAVDGCDFHSARRSPATEPCGGYLLLKLLMERGTLTCADLQGTGGAVHVA